MFCIYIYIYICIYVCKSISIYVHRYMYVYIYIYILFMYTYRYKYRFRFRYIYIYIHGLYYSYCLSLFPWKRQSTRNSSPTGCLSQFLGFTTAWGSLMHPDFFSLMHPDFSRLCTLTSSTLSEMLRNIGNSRAIEAVNFFSLVHPGALFLDLGSLLHPGHLLQVRKCDLLLLENLPPPNKP